MEETKDRWAISCILRCLAFLMYFMGDLNPEGGCFTPEDICPMGLPVSFKSVSLLRLLQLS